jgi:hypothetical protein
MDIATVIPATPGYEPCAGIGFSAAAVFFGLDDPTNLQPIRLT